MIKKIRAGPQRSTFKGKADGERTEFRENVTSCSYCRNKQTAHEELKRRESGCSGRKRSEDPVGIVVFRMHQLRVLLQEGAVTSAGK